MKPAVIEFDTKKMGLIREAAFVDETRVAVVEQSEKATLIGNVDVATGDVLFGKAVKSQVAYDFVFSPSRKYVAVRLFNGVVVIDAETGKTVWSKTKLEYPETVAWSGNEAWFGVGFQKSVMVLDGANGSIVQSCAFTGEAKAVAFNNSGDLFIGANSEIRVLRRGQDRTEIFANVGTAGARWTHAFGRECAASASEKGEFVITAFSDARQERFKFSGKPERMKFSQDDGRLAIGLSNGGVLIWDLRAGVELAKWRKPHYDRVDALDFSADGSLLLCLIDSALFVLDLRPGAKSRLLEKPKLPDGMLQCITIIGTDNRMDATDTMKPLNPLPISCPLCKLPDLDYVPQPYFIGRGIDSPSDLSQAEVGNFLVRERVKVVLETVAPSQCAFYPTHRKKGGELTNWYLAVPTNLIITGVVKNAIGRCKACGEPLHAHGTQYAKREDSPVTPFDIQKSKNWLSVREKPVADLSRWVDKRHALELFRSSYVSTRLWALFKKLGFRGMYQYVACREEPSPEDDRWAREKARELEGALPAKPGESSGEWLAAYLARQRKEPKEIDFSEVEKSLNLELPASYKEFVRKVGSKKFRNVDGEEGFEVRVLLPAELDGATFAGAVKDDLEAEVGKDGIVFAESNSGDVFCFKRGGDGPEPEVYRYLHEMDDFEPYARTFAGCVRAWTSK